MDKYVLDTNLFFNLDEGLDLGHKTNQVIDCLTQAAERLKSTKKAEFLMPPRIVEELLSFFKNDDEEIVNKQQVKRFLAAVIIKSPEIDKINFPAQVFYRLVEEIRNRSYRGLTIGDEEIKKAARLMQGSTSLSKKDFEIRLGPVIRNFRERYRQATRAGFLDSLADLDLIVLSKEVDGHLVSTDEGVIFWGRVFGVKEVPASVFGQRVRDWLSPS